MTNKYELFKHGFHESEIHQINELRKNSKFQIHQFAQHRKPCENIISTGSEKLDSILDGGGLRAGGITEIVGPSGSGKTQLCLQLCLSLQVAQPNKGTLYICTECNFPTSRLAQLCHLSPLATDNCSDNIFITHCYEYLDLQKTLETQIGFIMNKVGLIIIDSIAGIFRNTYPEDRYVQRAHDMRTLAHLLHEISVEHNVLVVCTNQVTSAMTYLDKTIPALGISWSNLVTNRFVMEKSVFNQHTFRVDFSPYLPSGACVDFDICAEDDSFYVVQPSKKRTKLSSFIADFSSISATHNSLMEDNCPQNANCSDLVFPCIKCSYSYRCVYGNLTKLKCSVLDGLTCSGERTFEKEYICQYCYQTDPWQQSCVKKASCSSVASPQSYYKTNCTVHNHVFCLGSRKFLKNVRCNWTGGYKWSTALILSITMGGFGADRFYLGHWQEGIGKVFSFGGLGVWTIIDVILIAIRYLGPADGSLYL